MISFASGSEIVFLQDFIIFAGMPSTPVAFLEFYLNIKRIYTLRGDGTETENDSSRGMGNYCLDAGMIEYIFRDNNNNNNSVTFVASKSLETKLRCASMLMV